jgi:hypothetical protein
MTSPYINRNRSRLFAAYFALAASCLVTFGQSVQPLAASHREPVLVELFTSEGCSDCPPADALLARLDATQFVPGAQAIVLSEHVTYWDHQGWRDPFSLDAMTERQQRYVDRFALDSSYTPQIVVDGKEQVVGNNVRTVTGALSRAASKPKSEVAIADAHWTNGAVVFSIKAEPRNGTTLVAAIAEDTTQSEVARGENAGRTLHHVAVVRVLKDLGANALDGRSLRLAADNVSHPGSSAGPLRLVVFLVDPKTGHVAAVTEQTVPR